MRDRHDLLLYDLIVERAVGTGCLIPNRLVVIVPVDVADALGM